MLPSTIPNQYKIGIYLGTGNPFACKYSFSTVKYIAICATGNILNSKKPKRPWSKLALLLDNLKQNQLTVTIIPKMGNTMIIAYIQGLSCTCRLPIKKNKCDRYSKYGPVHLFKFFPVNIYRINLISSLFVFFHK